MSKENETIFVQMPHYRRKSGQKQSNEELDNWLLWQALEYYMPFLEGFKDNSESQKENYERAELLRLHFRDGVMRKREMEGSKK